MVHFLDTLHPRNLGLSLGILTGLYMLLLGLLAAFTGRGVSLVGFIGTFYWGYEPTLLGSLAGAAWGFLDGFIGGALVALLYNFFTRKGHAE
ncbi:bacteriophage holin [Candidatus Woesearchaeota archaeon]|nr:bacteriophage holin [Candidatus Woesearchaeota archaeon]